MTQSLLSRFDLSDERIAALQEQLRQKGVDARQQAAQLFHSLEVQTTEVAVRLQENSLSTVCDLGATTLSTTADWVDKMPVIHQSASQFRKQATALQEAKHSVGRPSIEDYDELNVGEVNDALADLSIFGLQKVRRYEAANKDRVTVLREVDRRLEKSA